MNRECATQRKRCDETPAWQELQKYYDAEGRGQDLRAAFADDASRLDQFSQQAPHLFADLSKNLIDRHSQQLLLQLARDCDLEKARDAMFAGAEVNASEGRAAMHWLLRQPA